MTLCLSTNCIIFKQELLSILSSCYFQCTVKFRGPLENHWVCVDVCVSTKTFIDMYVYNQGRHNNEQPTFMHVKHTIEMSLPFEYMTL